jgi:hypothetical protein
MCWDARRLLELGVRWAYVTGRRDLWSADGSVERWRCRLRVPAPRGDRKDAGGHASLGLCRGVVDSSQVRRSLRCLPFGHVNAGKPSSAHIHC